MAAVEGALVGGGEKAGTKRAKSWPQPGQNLESSSSRSAPFNLNDKKVFDGPREGSLGGERKSGIRKKSLMDELGDRETERGCKLLRLQPLCVAHLANDESDAAPGDRKGDGRTCCLALTHKTLPGRFGAGQLLFSLARRDQYANEASATLFAASRPTTCCSIVAPALVGRANDSSPAPSRAPDGGSLGLAISTSESDRRGRAGRCRRRVGAGQRRNKMEIPLQSIGSCGGNSWPTGGRWLPPPPLVAAAFGPLDDRHRTTLRQASGPTIRTATVWRPSAKTKSCGRRALVESKHQRPLVLLQLVEPARVKRPSNKRLGHRLPIVVFEDLEK